MPNPSASPRKLVPLFALFALAVILLVARVTETRRDPAQVVTKARADSGSEDLMKEVATESAETRRVNESAPGSMPATSGALRLRVVDADTGAALAGAVCHVYSEFGDHPEFGVRSTDDDGRASIDSLPEGTILVRVERRPPHAAAYAAAEVRAGETRDLEVRVGAGGSIVGRVVDDLGQPIESAEIRCDAEPRGIAPSRKCEVHSLHDGRFELSHVLDCPRSVSIVEGRLHAERWMPVGFQVSRGAVSTRHSASVEPGACVDVGDIVLTRARSFSGRVLTSARAPVVGALVDVTMNTSVLRAAAMRDADSNSPRVGLTRTREDGSFEFESVSRSNRISVATAGGITQGFPIPPWEPGAQIANLELILATPAIVEFELFDEAGARITGAFESPAESGVQRLSRVSVGDREMAAWVRRSDGLESFTRSIVDSDGRFRLQLGPTGKFDCSVRLEVRGYMPAELELAATTDTIESRRLTLKRQPFVFARIVSRGIVISDAKPPPPEVVIHACLASPAEVDANRPPVAQVCCGLGSSFTTQFDRLDRDIDLPVRTLNEPFWLHVVVRGIQRTADGSFAPSLLHEQHLGPFFADATRHQIEIPDITIPASDSVKPALSGPKPKSQPKARDREQVRVRITWSEGEPIDKDCMVHLVTAGDSRERLRSTLALEAGTRVFDGPLVGKALLIVGTAHDDPALGSVACMQSIEVHFPRDESIPVRLAPWKSVEVRVGGAVRGFPDAQVGVVLRDLDILAYGGSASPPTCEGVMLADRTRVFRTYVAPGNYELRAHSALFVFPVTTLEVRNTDALQVFELSATRR